MIDLGSVEHPPEEIQFQFCGAIIRFNSCKTQLKYRKGAKIIKIKI